MDVKTYTIYSNVLGPKYPMEGYKVGEVTEDTTEVEVAVLPDASGLLVLNPELPGREIAINTEYLDDFEQAIRYARIKLEAMRNDESI